jgi:hypothetical protein
MYSSRHPETDGLTERVNNMFPHLLRCFCCCDGSNLTYMLPQVEFAYNAFRALGIERTPFEANYGFFLEEPPHLLFIMRPSIPVSQDALERLRMLKEVHNLVRSALQLHHIDSRQSLLCTNKSIPKSARNDNFTSPPILYMCCVTAYRSPLQLASYPPENTQRPRRLTSCFIKTIRKQLRDYVGDVAGNGGDTVTATGVGSSLQSGSHRARTGKNATTRSTYRTESRLLS